MDRTEEIRACLKKNGYKESLLLTRTAKGQAVALVTYADENQNAPAMLLIEMIGGFLSMLAKEAAAVTGLPEEAIIDQTIQDLSDMMRTSAKKEMLQ